MSREHKLKTLPVYFDAVCRGDKRFEIRKNDRDFQTGDILYLEEFDPGFPPHPEVKRGDPPRLPTAPGYRTGRSCRVEILYTLHGGRFGVDADHVVLSISEPDTIVGDPTY